MYNFILFNPPFTSVVKIAVKRCGFLLAGRIACIGETKNRPRRLGDAGSHCAVGSIYDETMRALSEGPCYLAIVVFNPPINQLPRTDKIFTLMRHFFRLLLGQDGGAALYGNDWQRRRGP